MRAYLKNLRQSPRKVRKVADLVRGKSVDEALVVLRNTPKRATGQVKKVIDSAIANAKSTTGAGKEDLYLKSVRVDKGTTLKRSLPRAQGRATPINKRTSSISVQLGSKKLPEAKEAKEAKN